MKAFNDDIGKKIAIIRKSCGISAKDLSLAIGKKSNYIYKIEKGYFKPSTAPFFDICEYFDISPMVLINTKPEEFENIVILAKRIEALDENKKEKVMEQFFSLIEQKMSEALKLT